jgi:hypothetical protein
MSKTTSKVLRPFKPYTGRAVAVAYDGRVDPLTIPLTLAYKCFDPFQSDSAQKCWIEIFEEIKSDKGNYESF